MRAFIGALLTCLLWGLLAMRFQEFATAVDQAIVDIAIAQRVTQKHMLDLELRLRRVEK